MHAAVLVFHVLISLFLIGLILVQHGKGADAGAAFGSGASATVFGARGSASFLSKTTAILALCFFSTSFWLDYLSASTVEKPSLIQNAADSTDVVETTIEPIEDDKPATDGAKDTDLPAVPEIMGDEDRPDIGPDPKGTSETPKDADEPPTDKSTSKAGEDGPAAPPDDKKTAPPDPEPAQPTADPAPEKESEASGPDAAGPNAPVKGEVKLAPEPGAASLENSATPAEKAAPKKVPAEKSR